jgi:hypothetical protein
VVTLHQKEILVVMVVEQIVILVAVVVEHLLLVVLDKLIQQLHQVAKVAQVLPTVIQDHP